MRSCLSLLFSAASLAAQSLPELQLAVLSSVTEARVAVVPQGAPVALMLGFDAGHVPLPGGVALGLQPITMAPLAFADADGIASVRLTYPIGAATGLQFLAQAIAADTSLPLGQPGSLVVTPVRAGAVPHLGEEIDIVVLFGQSNAEGFARRGDLRADLAGRHPRVRIWNSTFAVWQPVEAGVNTQLTAGAPFFGPEMGIVDSAASLAQPLWLVKLAVSSSSLGPTAGPWNEWGIHAAELYPAMLQQIDSAATAARALGYTPRVRLICMMQGETDSLSATLASIYQTNLEELLVGLRHDLRVRRLHGSREPLIRIGLVSSYLARLGFPDTMVVRAAQRATAERLSRCATVETEDLELMPDRVHFAAAGLLELGRRMITGGW